MIPTLTRSYKPTAESHDDLVAIATVHELARQKKEKKMKKLAAKEPWREGELPATDGLDMFWHDHLNDIVRFFAHLRHLTSQGAEAPAPHDDADLEAVKAEAERKRLEKVKANKAARKSKQAGNNATMAALPAEVRKIEKKAVLDEATNARREKRRKEKEVNAPRRLGRDKYQAPELSTQILLKEDLPAHLRSLTAPVDPFSERFDSLQRRSIIEPRPAPGARRKPVKGKQMKYKPKKYYNEWDG